MTNKACCFTGHRDLPKNIISIRKLLKTEVLSLIEKGVTDYYVGGAVGFDTLAAKVCLELRMSGYPIKVHLIYPFEGFTSKWSPAEKATYNELLPKFDSVKCASKEKGKNGFYARNRCLADASSYRIAYMTKESGGTAYTYNYSKNKGSVVINIAESK